MTQNELDKVDVLSGWSPRHFTNMASMLRHAAENEDINAAIRDSLEVSLLRQIHEDALGMQTEFNARFAKLAINPQWEDAV